MRSKIIPFQSFFGIFHQRHIFMPTSSIGNNIQMLLVSFIDNEVVNDTSLIICKHCQCSRVILQPLDVGHGEAFHEQISVLAINSSLEHVRHIKDRTVLPKMKKIWGFLSVQWKGGFLSKEMFDVHEPAGNYSAPLYEIRRTPKMTHQRNNSDMENNQEIGIGNIIF